MSILWDVYDTINAFGYVYVVPKFKKKTAQNGLTVYLGCNSTKVFQVLLLFLSLYIYIYIY